MGFYFILKALCLVCVAIEVLQITTITISVERLKIDSATYGSWRILPEFSTYTNIIDKDKIEEKIKIRLIQLG